MVDVAEAIGRYVTPRKPPRPLEVEWAGETYGCDPAVSELMVPFMLVHVPRGVLRLYDQSTSNICSAELPDPHDLWDFLHPQLVGRDLHTRGEEGNRTVDDAIAEMLRWPHGAWYYSGVNDQGTMLAIKAQYDPYWDSKE